MATRIAPWVSCLHTAARCRVPLVLVLNDGTRVAGLVSEIGITFAVVAARRVDLSTVVDCLRKDGRRWTAGRQVTT